MRGALWRKYNASRCFQKNRLQQSDVYKRQAVYGDYSYSHTAVVDWCNKFRKGRESTKDLARPGPARASDENVRQRETGLRANRFIRVKELSQMLSISAVSYTHLDVYKRQV